MPLTIEQDPCGQKYAFHVAKLYSYKFITKGVNITYKNKKLWNMSQKHNYAISHKFVAVQAGTSMNRKETLGKRRCSETFFRAEYLNAVEDTR